MLDPEGGHSHSQRILAEADRAGARHLCGAGEEGMIMVAAAVLASAVRKKGRRYAGCWHRGTRKPHGNADDLEGQQPPPNGAGTAVMAGGPEEMDAVQSAIQALTEAGSPVAVVILLRGPAAQAPGEVNLGRGDSEILELTPQTRTHSWTEEARRPGAG